MFRAFLFALLAANTAYFAVAGTTSKAIDSGAWLILLVLFRAETGYADRLERAPRPLALRAARLAAGAGVIAATVGYVFEDNVLDALNSALWIAVVVLLEIEMRYRSGARRTRVPLGALTGGLYAALALLVIAWAVRGQWFDAYDALLWLVAFATIELDVVAGKTQGNAPITLR